MNKELTDQLARTLCEEQSWRFLHFVDAGNSAAVFKIEHPQFGPAALKVYDPAFFSGDNSLIEAKRVRLQEQLRSHGNQHLIEILEVGQTSCRTTWYQLMEFCPWPNLEKRLGQIPDEQIEHLLWQLVDAVRFLSTRGLIHRDIKPANIAVDIGLSPANYIARLKYTRSHSKTSSISKERKAIALYRLSNFSPKCPAAKF